MQEVSDRTFASGVTFITWGSRNTEGMPSSRRHPLLLGEEKFKLPALDKMLKL
jgi:hypothetical protein